MYILKYYIVEIQKKRKLIKKMAESEANIMYVKNNKGSNHIFYDGYVYSQKTNLITAGKKSCCYRCANKSKCSSSISLLTGILDGTNSVIEPFKIVHSNIRHHDTCVLETQSSIGKINKKNTGLFQGHIIKYKKIKKFSINNKS